MILAAILKICKLGQQDAIFSACQHWSLDSAFQINHKQGVKPFFFMKCLYLLTFLICFPNYITLDVQTSTQSNRFCRVFVEFIGFLNVQGNFVVIKYG